MKTFKTLLLTLLTVTCLAQKKKLRNEAISQNIEWSVGKIFLKDGSEIEGLVKYNDKTGVVCYQDGVETRFLTTSSVDNFKFFDENLERDRIFFSLRYNDLENGSNRFHIFELLKEFGNFLVVSKTDRIEIEEKINKGDYRLINPSTTKFSQTETIFIVTTEGDIKPYIKIVEKEFVDDDAIFSYDYTKTQNKFIDKDLLGTWVGEHYESLKDYAQQNQLNFKRKKDLMKILDHYAELIKASKP